MVELENYINSHSKLTEAQKQALLNRCLGRDVSLGFAESVIDIIDFELEQPARNAANYERQKNAIAALSFKEHDLIVQCISIVKGQYSTPKGHKRAKYFDIDAALEGLKVDGIVTAKNRLDDKTTRLLLNTIDRYKFEERLTGTSLAGAELRKIKPQGTYWLVDADGFNAEEVVSRLALSEEFFGLASQYLGPEAIHVQSYCWLSGASKTAKQHVRRNAQLFHRDQEFIKFLKIFIYLEDVGPEQGPHVYAKGTHIDGDKLFPNQESVSQRFTDQELASALGDKDAIVEMLGPRGTILAADTRGFHKGSVVNSGQRIMLQFEYAASLYGSPVEQFSLGKLAENQAHLKGCRVLDNYTETPTPVPVLAKRKKTLAQKLTSKFKRWFP